MASICWLGANLRYACLANQGKLSLPEQLWPASLVRLGNIKMNMPAPPASVVPLRTNDLGPIFAFLILSLSQVGPSVLLFGFGLKAIGLTSLGLNRDSLASCFPSGPFGTYQGLKGQRSCLPCPEGTTTAGQGSNGLSDCRCAAESIEVAKSEEIRSCVSCGEGITCPFSSSLENLKTGLERISFLFGLSPGAFKQVFFKRTESYLKR